MKTRTLLLLTLLVWGCSESADPPAPTDAGVTPDATAPTPDAGEEVTWPPVAPEAELELESVPVWMLTVVTDQVRAMHDGDDPIVAEIQQGTFTCPEVGPADSGVRWRPVVLPEDGAVEVPQSAGSGIVYVVACLERGAPAGLVAQVDAFASVFTNGAEQPGDVYGSGRYRLPLVLGAGPNVIAARGSTQGRTNRIRLWRTPHELAFNPQDMTWPHIVVDEPLEAPLGVPVLNLTDRPALGLRAWVEDNEYFEETMRTQMGIPAGAVTQVAFDLKLKAPLTITATQAPVPVKLRVESLDLEWSYQGEVEIQVRPRSRAYRATFISDMDRSVQYYGVRSPETIDPSRDYSLILSLHGAGVEGLGQANAYGPKDWGIVLAATNRRRFGFDWEDWGRLDALEVLAAGRQAFKHDITKTYVTGHSMGGHGTWHVGVTHPGLFALMGPSAGWSHFDVYGGPRSPPAGPGIAGVFGAAQQHSQTPTFLGNLSRRAVYILHGDADNNVPVSQARDMRRRLEPICEDLHYHEEPGRGHWWDGYPEPGAACVDWPPMMELMQQRAVDPYELEFEFTTAGPWVNPHHSFVDVLSALDPYAPVAVTSRIDGDTVVLTSTNARTIELDGTALLDKGVANVEVDGERRSVSQSILRFGPDGGKVPGVYGPVKEAFFRPFLYVYPDDSEVYRELAAYFTTYWSFIGNGYAPAVPLSRLTDEMRDAHNIVYLGVGPEGFRNGSTVEIEPRGPEIMVGEDSYTNSAAIYVMPEGDRLSAVYYATPGYEALLFAYPPFRSGFGLPDFWVYTFGGTRTAGFFGPDWSLEPGFRR